MDRRIRAITIKILVPTTTTKSGTKRERWGKTKIKMKQLIRILGLVPMLLCCTARADDMVAMAQLPHDKLLSVMDRAAACDGGPAAAIFDSAGKKLEQTCDVHFANGGISTRFAGHDKTDFYSQSRFTAMHNPFGGSK